MSSHPQPVARAPRRFLLLVLSLAVLLGAAVPALAAPGRGSPPAQAQADRELTVMTRNLYLGAELGDIFTATSFPALIGAVTSTYGRALASDFPARAELLADEIVAAGPHLVGLQEVSLWREGPPGADPQALAPAETVVQDFLALLLEALERRGVHYSAISVVEAFDGSLPAAGAAGFFNVRLTDRDVILVRADVPASQVKVGGTDAGIFEQLQVIPTLTGPIEVLRGWTSADVKVRGSVVRFVNTHLEAFGTPALPAEDLRELQVAELLAGPLDTRLPVILVGDFNSPAPGGAAYLGLLGGGFTDVWSQARPGDAGLTCCHAADLLNPTAEEELTSRIDLILTRGGIGVRDATVIGVDPAFRTPEGRWPSDHAGVVATLTLPVR